MRRRFEPRQLLRSEILALQMILADRDTAAEAAREFSLGPGIDGLYPDGIGLLGQIASRGFPDEQCKTIEAKAVGYRRYTWTKNQYRIVQAAEFISALSACEIETVLLYELAAVVSTYADASVRPIYGLDCLVHPKNYTKALDILSALATRSDAVPRKTEGAQTIKDERQVTARINIHSRILDEYMEEDSVWSALRPYSLAGMNCFLLSREDAALHTLLRLDGSKAGTALWFVDACAVFREFESTTERRKLLDRIRQLQQSAAVKQVAFYVEETLKPETGLLPWSPDLQAEMLGLSPGVREIFKAPARTLQSIGQVARSSLKSFRTKIAGAQQAPIISSESGE